jgi:translation elongation factor EF-G
MVLQDSRDKSWLFNIIDEVTTGIRLADGMLLVVDCIEGVTF